MDLDVQLASQPSSSPANTTQAKLLVGGKTPPPLERDFTVVGKPINRLDALEKVTGRALYSGDIEATDALHLKFLRSPYSHARILLIDSSKAEAMPGVRAVIHRGKLPTWTMYFYGIPQTVFPETVTWAGQEVAAVAAEDEETAARAARMIKVVYEPLPHTLDVESALALDAPLVRPLDEVQPGNPRAPKASPKGNLYEGKPSVLKRGNLETGFSDADVVIEDVYTIPFQYHACMQTRASIARFDGEKLTFFDSCQGLWPVREDLAKSLDIPEDRIRIVVKYEGGGFGSKAGAQRYMHLIGKLALLTREAVRIELNRSEEFKSHPHRWGAKVYLKIGARLNGRLTAIQERCLVNLGTGSTYGNMQTTAIEQALNLYECPNMYLEQLGVYTNAQLTGYMRGIMSLPGNFALEAHIDKLAAALDLDPYKLRLANYSLKGIDSYLLKMKGQTVTGGEDEKLPYSSKRLDKCMEVVTKAIGWHRRDEITRRNEGKTKRRGIGMASLVDIGGVGVPPFRAGADVIINRDGSVDVIVGVVDIGGGQATALGMIASEELGVDMKRIRMRYGDSEGTKYAPSTHAQRIIAEVGPPVLQAASEARERLFEIVAPILHTAPSSLASRQSVIYVKNEPAVRVSFEEACKLIPEDGVRGTGSRVPNPSDVLFKVFGAKAADVEVDTETGEVRVVKVASAHEVGRILNPKLAASQHYGGVLMGLGIALIEEPCFDYKTGRMLNTDLLQYRLPTSLETPEITTFDIEDDDSFFAYCAKGFGNGTILGVSAAIRNALAHATGVWLNEMPFTPDRILDALHPPLEQVARH